MLLPLFVPVLLASGPPFAPAPFSLLLMLELELPGRPASPSPDPLVVLGLA
jgi:hypothetical protein